MGFEGSQHFVGRRRAGRNVSNPKPAIWPVLSFLRCGGIGRGSLVCLEANVFCADY